MMVAKSVHFSGHHYIPGLAPGFFIGGPEGGGQTLVRQNRRQPILGTSEASDPSVARRENMPKHVFRNPSLSWKIDSQSTKLPAT